MRHDQVSDHQHGEQQGPGEPDDEIRDEPATAEYCAGSAVRGAPVVLISGTPVSGNEQVGGQAEREGGEPADDGGKPRIFVDAAIPMSAKSTRAGAGGR